MLFFFDTEFMEDGKTIEPISIGMVSEAGASFYAEFKFQEHRANEWVRKNVFPHLGPPNLRQSREAVRYDLLDYVETASGGTRPEFWAYYCAYDWVLLCQLFGAMVDLPHGWPMYCNDLKQKLNDVGNPYLGNLVDEPENVHNALSDALWNRDVYNSLIKLKGCDDVERC